MDCDAESTFCQGQAASAITAGSHNNTPNSISLAQDQVPLFLETDTPPPVQFNSDQHTLWNGETKGYGPGQYGVLVLAQSFQAQVQQDALQSDIDWLQGSFDPSAGLRTGRVLEMSPLAHESTSNQMQQSEEPVGPARYVY